MELAVNRAETMINYCRVWKKNSNWKAQKEQKKKILDDEKFRE